VFLRGNNKYIELDMLYIVWSKNAFFDISSSAVFMHAHIITHFLAVIRSSILIVLL